MADMPSYDPSMTGDDDSFADELAGNSPHAPRAPLYTNAPRQRTNMLYGIAQSQLLGLAENGKSDLVRNVAGIAAMVREIATQVENVGIEPFAGYARRTADLVDDLHGNVRDKSVEDLIGDGRAIVRNNPEIAIVIAAVAGFLVARILKARR